MKQLTKSERHARSLSRRRSHIMHDAHMVAKFIVNAVGDYQIAMSLALKFVYKFRAEKKAAKDAHDAVKLTQLGEIWTAAPRAFEPEFVAGVPAWAIKKDFSQAGAQDVLFFTVETKIVKKTEKAVQVEFSTKNPKEHGFIDHPTTWVAKSIMAA